MTGLRRHPGWLNNARHIQTLDPDTDWLDIYRRTAFWDFTVDTMLGLQLAFIRTFAAPRIADVLHQAGEIHERPRKRAFDTGIVMYELIAAGFDAPRGREMLRMLNRAHRGWGIQQVDFQYVLSSFVVTPLRFCDTFGWRPLLDAEKQAATTFYVELGRHMGVTTQWRTFAEVADFFDDYERSEFRRTPAGVALMQSNVPLLAERLPGPLRRRPEASVSALFNDRRLADALALPPPGRPLVWAIRAGLSARNAARRRQPPMTSPWFTPGQPVAQYPDGYDLDQIGPDSARTP